MRKTRGKKCLRILALVTDAYGAGGGIAQFNRDLTRALIDADVACEVRIIPSGPKSHGKMVERRVIQFGPSQTRFNYLWRVVWTLISQGPFDVVFCGHLHLSPVGKIAASLAHAKFWLQLHGIEAWERSSRLRQWSVESADLVTSVSRYTRRRFLRWARNSPSSVRVLPNTVSDRFHPGAKPRDLIEHLSIAGKKILLTVGRLSAEERYKGHDRVIECLPALIREIPDLVYLIVGEGKDRYRLEVLARRHGVDDKVRFLGRIGEEDLPDYFRLADVYVMPSTGEGFGIVFIEAVVSGVPVIAGNSDGSVDALADGRLGTLVAPHDRDSLVQAIRAALRKPHAEPGQAARFDFVRYARHVHSLVGSRLT